MLLLVRLDDGYDNKSGFKTSVLSWVVNQNVSSILLIFKTRESIIFSLQFILFIQSITIFTYQTT
jgi:hypothetical protein